MLYAITDRRLFAGDEDERRRRLLEQAAIWAANGVAFIQVREKDLPVRDQVELGRRMMEILRGSAPLGAMRTRLLINGRADVALAAGADGVHLQSGPDGLTSAEVRRIFSVARHGGEESVLPYISVSCHTLLDVEEARRQEADCILFAPVFEKKIADENSKPLPGSGLSLLREACRAAGPVPVLALGGVTAENAGLCVEAGAAGIAAIRLMLDNPDAWRFLIENRVKAEFDASHSQT